MREEYAALLRRPSEHGWVICSGQACVLHADDIEVRLAA